MARNFRVEKPKNFVNRKTKGMGRSQERRFRRKLVVRKNSATPSQTNTNQISW